MDQRGNYGCVFIGPTKSWYKKANHVIWGHGLQFHTSQTRDYSKEKKWQEESGSLDPNSDFMTP
jgi:hypothetical protein